MGQGKEKDRGKCEERKSRYLVGVFSPDGVIYLSSQPKY